MRLRELQAEFIQLVPTELGATPGSFRMVSTLAEANGLWFLCPKCFVDKKGEVGTHHVLCWFVGVDMNIGPKPGRWTPQGTGLDDLTFVPSPGRSQSVALLAGCMWHGFLVNGDAT